MWVNEIKIKTEKRNDIKCEKKISTNIEPSPWLERLSMIIKQISTSKNLPFWKCLSLYPFFHLTKYTKRAKWLSTEELYDCIGENLNAEENNLPFDFRIKIKYTHHTQIQLWKVHVSVFYYRYWDILSLCFLWSENELKYNVKRTAQSHFYLHSTCGIQWFSPYFLCISMLPWSKMISVFNKKIPHTHTQRNSVNGRKQQQQKR